MVPPPHKRWGQMWPQEEAQRGSGKQRLLHLEVPRDGRLSMSCKAAWENTRVVRRQKSGAGEMLRPWPLLRFQGKARQGRVNCLGMACVNNFSGLWVIVVVFSCLAPSPGMVKAKEYSLKYRKCIYIYFIYRNIYNYIIYIIYTHMYNAVAWKTQFYS